MKTDHVQIAFLAIGLILLAALQDMVPPFCGAKPPFLLVFALYVALTASGRTQRSRKGARPVTRWIWTACAAGYLGEALSGLPLGCCIGFMLPVCAIVRFVASALPAAVAGAILFSILPKIERFAGLREEVEG